MSAVLVLIIHASECISGIGTCIEDIYNDANRTSRGGGGGAGEFGLHNIVHVRNHVASSANAWRNKCIISFIKRVECNYSEETHEKIEKA